MEEILKLLDDKEDDYLNEECKNIPGLIMKGTN